MGCLTFVKFFISPYETICLFNRLSGFVNKIGYLSLMKSLFLSLLTVSFFAISNAQVTPTWSANVAPILYQNCTPCHHGGGGGHGDFTQYDSAKLYAGSIAYYTAAGVMPPWPPDSSRHYAHERRLSQAEINTLQSWMIAGMPKGDTTLAPPVPIYSGSAQLTTPPDAVFTMPTFTIPSGGGNDVYWNFVIPTNTLQTQYIKGFEFIPGNAAVVHHALVFVDTGNTVLNQDAAYPGVGYPGFGGVGSNTAQLLGAYVPGSMPFLLPSGFGYKFPANSYLVFNMHYPQSAVGQSDSSKINVYYTNGTVREVFIKPILNHVSTMMNGPLSIPANQTRTFYERYTLPQANVSVFGVAPHMHLIGRNIRSVAVPPASTDTIPLINIPNWNFKWQGAYYFQKVQKIVGGTKLYAQAFYDNTLSNPLNPSNPPQNVSAGENTTDEMMLVYFIYTLYQPGDENIILDSTLLTTGIQDVEPSQGNPFSLYPNPNKGLLYIQWHATLSEKHTWSLHSTDGRLMQTGTFNTGNGPGKHLLTLGGLPPAVYLLEIRNSRGIYKQMIQME